MRRLIVGIGNPLLGDDGVGIEVARRLNGKVDADVKVSTGGGVELAEMLTNYDFALIVDAFKGEGVKEIDINDYKESVANHDIPFTSAYKMLSRYVKMPKVKIVGVGIGSIETKDKLSPKVERLIPKAIEMVEKIMEEKI